MFPLNTFYCKQDTVCVLSIYLIVCVLNFFSFYYFMSCDTTSWNWSFISFLLLFCLFVCAVSVIGRLGVGKAH
jgi:hypothetical protein